MAGLLAEAESIVIAAESHLKLNAADARRPLSRAEQRAKVRFGEMAELMDRGYSKVGELLAVLWESATEELVATVFEEAVAVPSDLATLALEQWETEPSEPTLYDLYSAITDALGVLELIYRLAEAMIADEAARQGALAAAARARANSRARGAVRATLTPLARLLASKPISMVTQNFRDLIMTPRAVASGEVSRAGLVMPTRESLVASFVTPPPGGELVKGPGTGMSKGFKQALDTGRQAVHSAHNAGRTDAAEHAGATSAFASEILDSNTCHPCAKLDGKDYKSFTEAREDYPVGGGYVWCDGGPRCRGTLIFLYLKGQKPLPLGDNPDGTPDPIDEIFEPLPEQDAPVPRYAPDPLPEPEVELEHQFPTPGIVSPDGDLFDGPLAEHRRAVLEAGSASEVREVLRKALGPTGATVTGTWSGKIDLTTSQEFADAILGNLERFPGAVPNSVSIRKLWNGAYAQTSVTSDGQIHLSLNSDYAKTTARSALYEEMARDVSLGHHHPSTGSIHGVVSHEFGHVLDALTGGQASGFTVSGGEGQLGRWLEEFGGSKDPADLSGVSGYSVADGTFNYPELLAESFTDVEMNGREARPLSIFVHRKILELWQASGRTIGG